VEHGLLGRRRVWDVKLIHCSPRSRFRRCRPGCRAYAAVPSRSCNAIIITNEKREILLTKRKYDPSVGKWDLPGGFVNLNETAEESVKREAKEELGIDLVNITYLCSGADRYMYKGVNYHTLGLIFVAKIMDTQIPIPNDDVTEVRYFERSSIDLDQLAFPSLRTVLEYYWSHETK
jgi:ADP-ribose pyrophosphatase YjhB (NUDIX family)